MLSTRLYPQINRKILAKVWRTVKRNNRDIGRTNFRDTRHTREYPPRYNNYNPDRQKSQSQVIFGQSGQGN